ncbi:MAG: hypothetical protein KC503_42540 [Myxococcales bacterium]|nr:hypothetical protein [Myxococcales bacterium]
MLGALAASNLIIAKKPDAKELLAKVQPYQGWMGAVSALWGIWGIISAVLHLGWLKLFPIWWATWLADSVLLAALGLLLGMGVLRTFIKNPQAIEKMNQTAARLAPKQGVLGIIAMCVGGWMIVARFLFL